jgi:hypothetical protein
MRAHVVEEGRIVNTIMVESLDVLPGLIDGAIGSIGDAVTEDGEIISAIPINPSADQEL